MKGVLIEPERLPTTSLIICSRNRPRLLQECVESVLHGEEVPTELIVVDDSDIPNDLLSNITASRPRNIRYHWRESTGLSSAVNFAIRSARYDLLVFTQDDAEVEPTWFSSIVRALLREGRRSLVTGQVKLGGSETPGGFAANVKVKSERVVYTGRIERDVLYAQNMAMYRSAAEEIGPFDERLGPGTQFPGSEDSDFAFRALEAGYSIVYEPAAAVRHRAWRDDEDYLRFRWGYGFARGGFYAKHISLRDRHMLRRLWRDLRNHLVPLPRLALHDRRTAFGHLALAGGVLAGAVRWTITERWRGGTHSWPGNR